MGGFLSIRAALALSDVVAGTDHVHVLSVGVAAAVLMVAGATGVLPAALRAARADPLIALRANELGTQRETAAGW